MKIVLATLSVLLVSAQAPAPHPEQATQYPKTEVFDGMPPPRLRHPRQVPRVVTVGAVERGCGKDPPGLITYACTTRSGRVYVPNPCDFPQERFAMLMCHELAHVDGWPSTHGE